jgi:hypothetical protein
MSKIGKDLDEENQRIYNQYFKDCERTFFSCKYWFCVIFLGIIIGLITTPFILR